MKIKRLSYQQIKQEHRTLKKMYIIFGIIGFLMWFIGVNFNNITDITSGIIILCIIPTFLIFQGQNEIKLEIRQLIELIRRKNE